MPRTTGAPRGVRRLVVTATSLVALAVLTTGCYGTWGLRSSYRTYITSAAGGEITTEGAVTWLDGPGTGKGPFQWSVDYAVFDAESEIGTVQMAGGVHTTGHPTAEGSVLDLSIWNPRLDINGDSGTLVADLQYRPFEGFAPGELPPRQAATDVPFATVDLSGVDWSTSNGTYTITAAPMTGISAAMELIGWDDFYGDPVALDPLTLSFDPEVFQPRLATTPTLTVSETDGLEPGDEVVVWGTGFDPAAHVGTRPPLAGQPSGAYVVHGRFAETWQPSAGAPSSTRAVISQVWALPAASRAILDPTSSNPSFVTIDQYGRFETTLTIGTSAASGIEGIYTYPGSGAVNAAQELAVPLDVTP